MQRELAGFSAPIELFSSHTPSSHSIGYMNPPQENMQTKSHGIYCLITLQRSLCSQKRPDTWLLTSLYKRGKGFPHTVVLLSRTFRRSARVCHTTQRLGGRAQLWYDCHWRTDHTIEGEGATQRHVDSHILTASQGGKYDVSHLAYHPPLRRSYCHLPKK